VTYLSHGKPSPMSDSLTLEGPCGARMSAWSASLRWLGEDDILNAAGTNDGGSGDGSSDEPPRSGGGVRCN
jgi:hypothetical protein